MCAYLPPDIFPLGVKFKKKQQQKWNSCGPLVLISFKSTLTCLFLLDSHRNPVWTERGESHFTDKEIEVEKADLKVAIISCFLYFRGPSSGFFLLFCTNLSRQSLQLIPATSHAIVTTRLVINSHQHGKYPLLSAFSVLGTVLGTFHILCPSNPHNGASQVAHQ